MRLAAIKVLRHLEPVAVMPHAAAVVSRLDDTLADVRRCALQSLGKFDAAVNVSYVEHIVRQLGDDSGDVCDFALLEPTAHRPWPHRGAPPDD